ncbi:MAG: hypothetical protein SPH08_03935, partial [Sodaliphilus sp.]|nr:hypothetical protein [Sodaliphilus sp.]
YFSVINFQPESWFYFFSALDNSRPHQMVNIQCIMTIMGGREISRPYQGNRFFMFLFLAPFTI